jgi:hypothetical protein
MFENTPSDRVQLVGRGDMLHPGCCALCRSGVCEEGYVDLGVYFDYEGQMYLCHTCTQQVAEVIGCLIPSEAAILHALVNSVQAENVVLKTELEVARDRLAAYDSVLANLSPSAPIFSGSPNDPIEQIKQITDAPADSTDDRESEVKEYSSQQGHSEHSPSKLGDITSARTGSIPIPRSSR